MENVQVSYDYLLGEDKSSEENPYSKNFFDFPTIKKKDKTNSVQSVKKRQISQKSTNPSINNANSITLSKISSPERPVQREHLKQNTFGFEQEDSITLDQTGKKLQIMRTSEFHESPGTKQVKEVIPEVKETIEENNANAGWQPEESVAVNCFGGSIGKESKTLEKQETLGWKPDESVIVGVSDAQKSEKEIAKGWGPVESVVLNGKGNISVGSPSFPGANSSQNNGKENKSRVWEVVDSVCIPNNNTVTKVELKTESHGNWEVMDSVYVNNNNRKENSEKNEEEAIGKATEKKFVGELPREKEKGSGVVSPQKNEGTFEIMESVSVGKKPPTCKILQKLSSSSFTLPETFFSKKLGNSISKNHFADRGAQISLLRESLCLNIDSFKLLYNKNTVVRMNRLQEDVKMRIKMPSMNAAINTKKIIPSNREKLEEKREKGLKGGKISKLMRINNRVYIQIHDIKEKLSRSVFLSNISGNLSKFHCWDQYRGYFYLCDNMGKIFVYIGNIKDDWGLEVADSSRKICELKLPFVIIDPVLYLMKISKDESVLLVIGGNKENKEGKIAPVDRIFVFYLRFAGAYTGSSTPLFQIKMRYGRIRPLVCKQMCGNEKHLLIIGGNNTKKIKREQLLNIDEFDNFKTSVKMCESIAIKTIKDTVFQCRMRAIKEILMENSLKIESLHKNIFKKMPTFSQGAVIRIKTGKVGEKEGKTNFFIGVGLSRRSVYYLDYLDYFHSCLSINKAFTKFVALGVISSEMVFFSNKTLYYLTEDNSEKNYMTAKIDFGDEKDHKTTRCGIF